MHYLIPKKNSLFFILFLISVVYVHAQGPVVYKNQENTKTTSDFMSKVRFGGGLGINFGNGYFTGSISPVAVYELNEYVGIGTGLTLAYSDFEYEKSWAYGVSLLTFINPVPFLQASVELEQLWVNREIELVNNRTFNDNFDNQALFVGLGYRTPHVVIGFRYNVLTNNNSVYSDDIMPFIRVYF